MRKTKNLIAAFCGATLLLASMTAGAAPKTLVFCSEGSPKVLTLHFIRQERPLMPHPARFSINSPNSKEVQPRLDQASRNHGIFPKMELSIPFTSAKA